MRLLRNDSTDPHFNMAFDQFCLEQLDMEEPVFYLWRNRPSVIIGLNQNAFGEVNLSYLESHGISLARRVTGGGAVYHDLQNLNYSIVGRSSDLEKDYPGYMNMIIEALRQMGVKAELSGRNDIMVGGRKVSGYAKRVWKDRLMVHGTLMWDVDIESLTNALATPGSKLESKGIASVRSRVANLKDELPGYNSIEEFKAALEARLSNGYEDGELELSEEQLAAIRKEADEKFSTWEWNFGHSLDAEFSRTGKFPCGTIELSYSLKRGCIGAISFGGDYMGNIPADALSKGLQGCRFNRSSLLAALAVLPVGSVFDGMTPEALADFILA